MNTKLIDSLVQIISSLTAEEKASLENKLATKQMPAKTSTFNFTDEPFVGMWEDRVDLADSSEWVQKLRQSEWTSKHD